MLRLMTSQRWVGALAISGLLATVWITWRWIVPDTFDGGPLSPWAWAFGAWGVFYRAMFILILCLLPALVADEVRRSGRK
jgi:hypothetical protein